MSISNDDAREIIERLGLASFAEIGPEGPTGKALIHFDDAELVVCDQTEGVCEPEELRMLRFEREYAARSGVTVEFLHSWGRFAEPCDCGASLCTGYRMGHQWEDAIVEDQLRTAAAIPTQPAIE